MKKYFLHNGSEQTGPFDIEELKSKTLNRDTPIWFDGLNRFYVAAEHFEVISPLFKTPPNIFDGFISQSFSDASRSEDMWLRAELNAALGPNTGITSRGQRAQFIAALDRVLAGEVALRDRARTLSQRFQRRPESLADKKCR